MAKEIAKRSDGTTGQLRVVAYFEQVVDGSDEDNARRSIENEKRATENANKTAQALASFKRRIDQTVQRRGSANSLGLSPAEPAALGTHEVAVIFAP